jgi:hypothetical protein
MKNGTILLATRWTDLVIHEICFVKEKTLKVINWQDEKNMPEWEL